MTRRTQEPEQNVELTGATNRQAFPARVVADDKAQEDNVRRVQAAKDADRERAMLPDQREALDQEPASATLDGGARVTGPREVVEALQRRSGGRGASSKRD
jgi:hypothetical protein